MITEGKVALDSVRGVGVDGTEGPGDYRVQGGSHDVNRSVSMLARREGGIPYCLAEGRYDTSRSRPESVRERRRRGEEFQIQRTAAVYM